MVVFTGGEDFGATPERDATERVLFDHALAGGLPILGVCRGMQLINEFMGGRTTKIEGHVATRHGVTMAPPWRELYDEEIKVNSYHELGIALDGLAPGLGTAATDSEGFVEALFHPDKPVAAIMWHPERAGAPAADRVLMFRLAEQGAFWA